MADYSMTSPPETCPLHFNRMAGQLRVALPGIIVSFDPASQTVTAQPALKMKVNLGDGEIKHMDYPVIQNVPVVLPFAQGAGLLLTLPVKPGDECLLVFADRAMDFFTQSGGIQPTDTSASEDTTTPRAHHLTDAICIPGLISNPQAVPDYNGEHIEIRDRERKQYFSLGPDGITITDGTAVWNMKDGKVTLNAPTGISYTTPANMDVRSRNMDLGDDNRILGNLRSVFGTVTDMGGVVLNTHTHNNGSQPDKTGSAAEATNNAAALKNSFDDTVDELERKVRDGEIEPLDEIDQLLLCLPDIAESVAGRQPLFEDFKGWTMLRDMFHKWFSGPANTEAKFYPEPYWVDWDWVMSYARARQAYEEMIASVGGIPYILSEKARTVLGGILREQNCLTSGKKYFDFIDMAGTDWQKWESWYHQHKRVGLGKPHIDDEGPIPDGLAVCLAGFTLRALARGWTEPNLEGGHSIHVSQVAVFVHDIFNFEDSGRWWTLDGELFFWNCEERSFSLNPLNRIPPSKWRYLDDGDLNDFRDRYGVGGDFLVLSQPHLVENFVPIRYDYIIKS